MSNRTWTNDGSLPKGSAFCPLRVPREVATEVVKYSFLRVAREMPHLRQFRPLLARHRAFHRLPAACRRSGSRSSISVSQSLTAA